MKDEADWKRIKKRKKEKKKKKKKKKRNKNDEEGGAPRRRNPEERATEGMEYDIMQRQKRKAAVRKDRPGGREGEI